MTLTFHFFFFAYRTIMIIVTELPSSQTRPRLVSRAPVVAGSSPRWCTSPAGPFGFSLSSFSMSSSTLSCGAGGSVSSTSIHFLNLPSLTTLLKCTRIRTTERPLITPLYLSSAGFNYVSMTSYTHFCFFQHIRLSAFMPSAGGSIHDGLAETCWFYAQNLPTVALLLPRAGMCVALLLALSAPQPGLVALADQGITRDSSVYFRAEDGALTGYARGVLYANAAWTAWRALVVLASWYVSKRMSLHHIRDLKDVSGFCFFL
jgi:hypothetical protein